MSFTDGKAFVVTAEQMKLRWGSRGTAFHCQLCGAPFKVGDTVRWIYANGTPGACTGNFFVCAQCDGENTELIARAKESLKRATEMAKQWGIYGPDWERDARKYG